MPDPRDLLPQPPWEGPPIPRFTQKTYKYKCIDCGFEVYRRIPPYFFEGSKCPNCPEGVFVLAEETYRR